MKRIALCFLLFGVVLILSACSNNTNDVRNNAPPNWSNIEYSVSEVFNGMITIGNSVRRIYRDFNGHVDWSNFELLIDAMNAMDEATAINIIEHMRNNFRQ